MPRVTCTSPVVRWVPPARPTTRASCRCSGCWTKAEELEDWNCCGATSYMCIDEGSAFLLSARNLSIERSRQHQHGRPGDSGAVQRLLPGAAQDPGLRRTAQDLADKNAILGTGGLAAHEFGAGPHPLEILYNDVGVDRIKSLANRPGRGGRIACYYGCQAVRPYDEVDKAHNPMRMDELMQAVGAHGRLLAQDQVLRGLAHRHHTRRGTAAELHPAEGSRPQGRRGDRHHVPAVSVQPGRATRLRSPSGAARTSICQFSIFRRCSAGRWARATRARGAPARAPTELLHGPQGGRAYV